MSAELTPKKQTNTAATSSPATTALTTATASSTQGQGLTLKGTIFALLYEKDPLWRIKYRDAHGIDSRDVGDIDLMCETDIDSNYAHKPLKKLAVGIIKDPSLKEQVFDPLRDHAILTMIAPELERRVDQLIKDHQRVKETKRVAAASIPSLQEEKRGPKSQDLLPPFAFDPSFDFSQALVQLNSFYVGSKRQELSFPISLLLGEDGGNSNITIPPIAVDATLEQLEYLIFLQRDLNFFKDINKSGTLFVPTVWGRLSSHQDRDCCFLYSGRRLSDKSQTLKQTLCKLEQGEFSFVIFKPSPQAPKNQATHPETTTYADIVTATSSPATMADTIAPASSTTATITTAAVGTSTQAASHMTTATIPSVSSGQSGFLPPPAAKKRPATAITITTTDSPAKKKNGKCVLC